MAASFCNLSIFGCVFPPNRIDFKNDRVAVLKKNAPNFVYGENKMLDWDFSPEIRGEVNELCSLINQRGGKSALSEKWMFLRDFNFSKPEILQESNEVHEVTSNSNLSTLEEEEIVNSLLQAVQSNSQFDVGEIAGNSLSSVFSTLRGKITDQELSNFCKMIGCWNDQTVLEECFNHLILPKLQEKNQSVCIISSLKDLAGKVPDKVSNNILIPLLTSQDNKFKDVELLNSIFPILPDMLKDNLISAIMKKNNFEEDDWLMLHGLVNDLTCASLGRVIEVMNNFADEFSSSQIFSKFLLAVCKNNQCSLYKDQLYQIVEKNKTLLKRQSLRFVEML